MTQDLRAQLADMIGPAEWQNLLPHAARDTLVVVNPDLDLLDVGMAIATDNTHAVQRWISEALIAKPTLTQLEAWECDRTHPFQALIVQPYVLIQEAAA